MQGHANQAGKEHATPASGPTCRVPGQPACCAQCSGGMPGRQGARAATHPGRERLRRGPGPAGRPQCPPGPPRPHPRSATGPPVAHVGRPPSPPSQPPDKEEGTLTRTAPASLHTTTASSGTACAVGEQGRRTRQHCCCSQEPRGGSAPLTGSSSGPQRTLAQALTAHNAGFRDRLVTTEFQELLPSSVFWPQACTVRTQDTTVDCSNEHLRGERRDTQPLLTQAS